MCAAWFEVDLYGSPYSPRWLAVFSQLAKVMRICSALRHMAELHDMSHQCWRSLNGGIAAGEIEDKWKSENRPCLFSKEIYSIRPFRTIVPYPVSCPDSFSCLWCSLLLLRSESLRSLILPDCLAWPTIVSRIKRGENGKLFANPMYIINLCSMTIYSRIRVSSIAAQLFLEPIADFP